MADIRYGEAAERKEPISAAVRKERVTIFDADADRDAHRGYPAAIKRISWGAIFAGAVVAIVTQILLNMLGLAIGLGAIDPATEANPLGGLGVGAGIWLVITTIIGFLAGGYAAGRLAGMPKKQDATWHGIVTWGVVTLFTFYLMTSTIGATINSATGILGQGMEFVGNVAPAVAEQLPGDIQQQIPDQPLEQVPNVSSQEFQQTADQVAATMSSVAFWAFIAGVIGLIAAAIGGGMGAPHDMPASEAVRRE